MIRNVDAAKALENKAFSHELKCLKMDSNELLIRVSRVRAPDGVPHEKALQLESCGAFYFWVQQHIPQYIKAHLPPSLFRKI